MLRALSLALLSSVALLAPASAADIRATKSPMISAAPAWSWAGGYFGLHGGWGFGDADYTFAPARGVRNFSTGPDGFLGGFQSGRNWQSGMWVFGLEGTTSFGSVSATGTTNGPTTSEVEITRLSTFTSRLGVANANWLFYGKGGLAYAEVTMKATAPGIAFKETTDHVGWTIGAGVEYALTPSWILGVEYNYVDLGSERYSGLGGVGANFDTDTDITLSTVMARLSYRFGAGGNPVAGFLFGPENPGGIWNGLYVGAHGGYGWGEFDARVAANPGVNVLPGGGPFGIDVDGGLGGVHIGHMSQRGNWVFGNEASFTFAGLSGSSALPASAFGAGVTGITATADLDWYATTTLRLGYSWGSWLLYGRGGAAVGEVKSSYSAAVAGGPAVWSESNAHIGWTLGAGLEYALGNWIAGVEYNYVDLGKQRYGGFDSTGSDIDFKADLAFSTVLARLSYRFGEPAPAVVTKY